MLSWRGPPPLLPVPRAVVVCRNYCSCDLSPGWSVSARREWCKAPAAVDVRRGERLAEAAELYLFDWERREVVWGEAPLTGRPAIVDLLLGPDGEDGDARERVRRGLLVAPREVRLDLMSRPVPSVTKRRRDVGVSPAKAPSSPGQWRGASCIMPMGPLVSACPLSPPHQTIRRASDLSTH